MKSFTVAAIARGQLLITFINIFFSPELSENWTDTKETLQEGMAFHLKYLGVTAVDQPKGEGMAAAAIRRIITVVKDHFSNIT